MAAVVIRDAIRETARRALSRPATHVVIGIGILALDLVTGPHLLFPILFVVPVVSSAWFLGPRWGVSLATSLPLGRLVIAELVDRPAPMAYSAVNALVRVAVLMLLALLVARTVRQTRELEAKVSIFVTMCAWSRTIEHEGEWLSFEEYLRRRFGVETTHGISPAAREKIRQAIEAERSGRNPGAG